MSHIVSNYHPPARSSESLKPFIFSGDKLHPEKHDSMGITRISKNVALSLSKIISGEERELQNYQILTEPVPTMDQCRAIANWAEKTGEPIYLLFGARAGDAVAKKVDLTQKDAFLAEISVYVNSKTGFMLARENPKDFGALTAMDMLSTEAMSRESIGNFVDRLLDPKRISGKCRDIFMSQANSRGMSRAKTAVGQLQLVNTTYEYAVQFIQSLGIRLTDKQIQRRFSTVEEFKEHIYRIKPELAEQDRGPEYSFTRRNGIGMIVECALVRAMDHVYDTLSSDRFRSLDKEAVLVMKKLKSIKGIVITNENETGFDIRYNNPANYFEGHVYLRKKNFFKILLKMAYNRRYGEAEVLKDLLGMRFETLNPNPENMANAVSFFEKEMFNGDAVYEQKGNLLDLEMIEDKEINFRPADPRKQSTNSKLKNGDITGTISYKEPGSETVTTGPIEMQYQYVGAMENGYNKREVYELKKMLSAAARILKGFDIKNLKFFIQLFIDEGTGISEQSILHHLFFPTEGWNPAMSPNNQDQEVKNIKEPTTPDFWGPQDDSQKEEPSNPSTKWISQYWDESHGFILPLRSDHGGVRFTTRDIVSPAYFNTYDKTYVQPASVQFDYLLKMYNRADVRKEVEDFKRKGIALDQQIDLI